MNSTAQFQQLEALFSQQLNTAEELETILQDESEALTKRNHEEIQRLSSLKETKTKDIETIGQNQADVLAKLNLTYSADALDQLINAMPSEISRRITHIRRKLETILDTCQQQNMVNGQIIAANRQAAETALAILRGQVSPDNLTYGATGQAISEQSSNPISKA